MSAPLPRPPAEIAWIADVIGTQATLRLIEAHGGTAIYVPHEVNQGSSLARSIGLEAARQMAAEWGGTRLKVPLCKIWRVQVMHAERKSYAEIARALGTTETSVWRMLHGLRLTMRQLDLFG